MPRLMEKKDWIQTVANVGAAESVWCENISSDGDAVPLPLPGRGTYQVILVKIMRDIGDHLIDDASIKSVVEKRRTCVWYDDVRNFYDGLLQVANGRRDCSFNES